MKPEVSYMNVGLPIDLKNRARMIVKKGRAANMTALVCEALLEKCCAIEAKEHAELLQQEDTAKLARQALRTAAGNPLAPTDSDLAPEIEPLPVTTDMTSDGDDGIYIPHAQRILAVLNSPVERDRAARAAIADIKTRRPLTHPPDAVILRRLEVLISDLRTRTPSVPPLLQEPPTSSPMGRFIDKLIGRIAPVDPPQNDVPDNNENE